MRQITIIRKKGFMAALAAPSVVIDGLVAGKVKNGATVSFYIDENAHEIYVKNFNGSSHVLYISAGSNDLNFGLKFDMSIFYLYPLDNEVYVGNENTGINPNYLPQNDPTYNQPQSTEQTPLQYSQGQPQYNQEPPLYNQAPPQYNQEQYTTQYQPAASSAGAAYNKQKSQTPSIICGIVVPAIILAVLSTLFGLGLTSLVGFAVGAMLSIATGVVIIIGGFWIIVVPLPFVYIWKTGCVKQNQPLKVKIILGILASLLPILAIVLALLLKGV